MIDWPSFWIGAGVTYATLVLGPIAIMVLVAAVRSVREKRHEQTYR